jgi:drug/metabolite transporter (DMT)-like permease
MYILSKQVGGNSQDDSFRYKGILLVLLSMVAGALSAISSKFAAVYSNKWAFIALTYTSSTGFTLLLSPFMFSAVQRQSGKECKAVSNGVMMGILNLGGFYLFLEALATGPLSLVASIVGMHFVVAVVLSLCIYKEHLTLWSFGGLVLTVASIFFLRG